MRPSAITLRGGAGEANRNPFKTFFAGFLVALLAMTGVVSWSSVAYADQNQSIAIEQVQIGEGTGDGGQLVLGDKVVVTGIWDASEAAPQAGDFFTIGLPPELGFDTALPIPLTGGDGTVWAECLTDPSTDSVTCTLTEAVIEMPELVHGTFEFEVEVVAATDEESVIFDLNGIDTPVELPGEGGIDDGIVLPDDWGKSGEMNSNNWSMSWTLELPGASMAGADVINIVDTMSDNHVLCDPANLQLVTVRGDDVVDVTDLTELITGDDPHEFTVRLTATEGGFNPNVTYVLTYDTCTPDGQIDPPDTVYENSAHVDIWGESDGVGVSPHGWHETLTKSGSVLGGGERNGKIAWTVTVPGDQLVGRDGINLQEVLGEGHEVCPTTIDNIRITERYGPSNQLQGDITSMLDREIVAQSAQGFEINYTINDPDFAFKASDYRYIITYETCVSQDDLPEGGTGYTNEVSVNGQVTGNEAKVPGRAEGKSGNINSGSITLDGVTHMPQTTLGWNITVPGERIADITSSLFLTDQISGAHQVCAVGDGGGLKSQLGLSVQARDQVQGGGLSTVDLTDSATAQVDGDGYIHITIPQPELEQPGGGTEVGFSTEYQFVISYTTCTTSGGMDAPGTTYGNDVTVGGNVYTSSVTQNNRGSGTGTGVPRGSIAISKSLVDSVGAGFVADGTNFVVRVAEVDPDGVTQVEYDLEVPLNGDPVSGPNSRGNGWTVELSEPTFPSVPGVSFGTPRFEESEGVTPSADGSTAVAQLIPGSNIAVSLENSAELGQVSLTKVVTGGAGELVDPERVYQVTASVDTSGLGDGFPAQPDRVLELVAGVPVVLSDLPIGAVVTFDEVRPVDDDQFTWGDPVFDPASVVVSADHVDVPAEVTLTNSVERTVGTFSIVKTVTGEQADNPAVPDVVEVTATWSEEGQDGSKVLQVPTDGTPVALDELLLIGTQVTLTETPLEDGSSIAWGAPTWSGTGVEVAGESAVVTVGRDVEAQVTLENHAATSVAGLSLLKGVAGEAAGEVDPSTQFPVTATWTDVDGVEESVELLINAVEPTALGVELPAGTVVTVTEGTRPGFDTVDWGSITISGEQVTDLGDGSAEVVISDQQDDMTLVTVVNEANWAPGTFNITKQVTGLLPDDANIPAAVDVIATWTLDGEEFTETLVVPTDGTSVNFGTQLPHGTQVTLAEAPLAGSESFTWDMPVWDADGIVNNGDGTATIIISAATDLDIALTNNATEKLGSLTIVKVVNGTGASEVSADTVFSVTATWTDLLGESHEAELEVSVNQPAVLEGIPLGTEVVLTEDEADVSDAEWIGATWSSAAENVAIDADGTQAVITVTGDAGVASEVELTNEFEKTPEIPVTGTTILAAGLTGIAVLLIAGTALLVIRRRNA